MVEDSSIKVAVRLRPFNAREKNQGDGPNLVIGMEGAHVTIGAKGKNSKTFKFDHSLWSHDDFKEQAGGYLAPASSSSKYADQNFVYKELGAPLLENALEGFNCAIFAYGQTGSGKSYSIFGSESNKGIIPMLIENLYKHIDRTYSSGEVDYSVTVSMLEIYNEKVRDLLSKKNQKEKKEIKFNEKKEFVVHGLSEPRVYSYKEVEYWLKTGDENRTIAATKMNETSSRAHTIFTIKLIQKFKKNGEIRESEIVLVDLAGSEKIGKTGTEGERRNEGIKINQSLTTLGKVFKCLHDQQKGRGQIKPPYRESALTKLLKRALSGNSKTVMIAAISPDLDNYEETMSTLNYANTVKSLKTKAIINIQSSQQAMSDLQRELERLRQEQANQPKIVEEQIINLSDEERKELEDKIKQQREELEIEIKKKEDQINALTSSYEQRLEAHKAESEAKIKELADFQEKKRTEPHFWNLAQDSRQTGNIVYFLHRGVTMGGSQENSGIPLKFPGIRPQERYKF